MTINTCSFASHCRSGSGRTARRPGVRPSLSARRGERTASGWSTGKHTRSPASALQTRSQSPAVTEEKDHNQHGSTVENPFLFFL